MADIFRHIAELVVKVVEVLFVEFSGDLIFRLFTECEAEFRGFTLKILKVTPNALDPLWHEFASVKLGLVASTANELAIHVLVAFWIVS